MAVLVIGGLACFQLAWHGALDWENAVSSSLRRAYLHTNFDKRFFKPSVALILDLVAPGLAGGIIFGVLGRPTRLSEVTCFCTGVGVTLSSLYLYYPLLVSYELWWLNTHRLPFLLVFWAAVGGSFGWVGSFGYYLKQRDREGLRGR